MSRIAQSRHIAITGAIAALALAVTGGAASAQGKPWVHGVIQPKADAGVFMMAEQRGFFKKFGLDVKVIKIKNDQIGLKAALAGQMDSYEGGPGGAMVADSRGVDVRVIGCPWLVVPHGIFVHDNIKSLKDLEGKTIAISAPGSFPDILAHAAFAKYHIPTKNIKFASVGGDLDRYKALVAHVVDAAVVSGEYLPIAKKEHIKMLVSGGEALPNFVRTCIQAPEATLKARPKDAAKFVAAEIEALHYAASHKAETVKVAQEVTGIKPSDPRPAFIFDLAMKQHAIGVNMPIPMKKMAWLQDELIKLGKIKHKMEVAKYVDAGPREAALKLIAEHKK